MGAPRSPETKARYELVRTRVEDWLGMHGATRSEAARHDAEILFVRTAIRVGRDRGMRLWKDNAKGMEETALKSLRYLLREYSVRSARDKIIRTGGNAHWVMDLWEAAINELTREAPRRVSRPPDPAVEELPEPLARTTAQELKDLNGHSGPQVFKEELEEVKRSLAMRVLDAYLEKDDGLMLELTREIEQLEREVK